MDLPAFSNSSRSQSRILLQTFALRIAVAAAYGHLGTLRMQGLSEQASTALPRMLKLLLLPGTVIADFALCLVKTAFMISFRASLGYDWTVSHAIMMLLDLRVWEPAGPSSNPANDSRLVGVSIDEIDPACVEFGPMPMTQAHVDVGRAVVLLALLAQSVASLWLVARRFTVVADAALVVDWSNGIYALIGICTAVSSLGILAMRGRKPQVKAGKELTGPHGRKLSPDLKLIPSLTEGLKKLLSFWPMWTSGMLQSYHVRVYWPDSPFEMIQSAWLFYIFWLAGCTVLVLVPLGRNLIDAGKNVSAFNRLLDGDAEDEEGTPINDNDTTQPKADRPDHPYGQRALAGVVYFTVMGVATTVLFVYAFGEASVGAMMQAELGVFYAAHVHEQVLIYSELGKSSALIQNWAWNDPWSEKLFVY